jgi:hypothetical protein
MRMLFSDKPMFAFSDLTTAPKTWWPSIVSTFIRKCETRARDRRELRSLSTRDLMDIRMDLITARAACIRVCWKDWLS